MYLKIQKVDSKILKKSEKYFGDIFCKYLNKEKFGTYKESLIARYLIEQNKGVFSSISHKKNLVFVGSSDKKIGVDVEIVKERDVNLLNKFRDDEYEILGGKDWINFYILWTAKESIIKYNNLNLDKIEDILLIEKSDVNNILSGIRFTKIMIFEYENILSTTYGGIDGEFIFSICV